MPAAEDQRFFWPSGRRPSTGDRWQSDSGDMAWHADSLDFCKKERRRGRRHRPIFFSADVICSRMGMPPCCHGGPTTSRRIARVQKDRHIGTIFVVSEAAMTSSVMDALSGRRSFLAKFKIIFRTSTTMRCINNLVGLSSAATCRTCPEVVRHRDKGRRPAKFFIELPLLMDGQWLWPVIIITGRRER